MPVIALHRPPHGGLQTGKGEIQPGPAFEGHGQRYGTWVTLGRQCLDRRSAGLAQFHELCGLVEGFANGIVDGGPQTTVLPHPLDQQGLAMPPADQQQQVGKGDV